MKKTFIILASGIASAFALNSCNNGNPAEQAAKDNAAIDSMVNVRLSTLRTSLATDCNNSVMLAANTKADSTITAMATDKGSKKTTSSKPKTVTPPPPPQKKGLQGLSDQSKQQQQDQTTTPKKKGLQGLADPKTPK